MKNTDFVLFDSQLQKNIAEKSNLQQEYMPCMWACKKKDCCKKYKKGKRCKSCPND
jgi:hypothetical protein